MQINWKYESSCFIARVQAGTGGGVVVWGIFSWYILEPLASMKDCLNAAAYLGMATGLNLGLKCTPQTLCRPLPAGQHTTGHK